jgi:hypothetical protein
LADANRLHKGMSLTVVSCPRSGPCPRGDIGDEDDAAVEEQERYRGTYWILSRVDRVVKLRERVRAGLVRA